MKINKAYRLKQEIEVIRLEIESVSDIDSETKESLLEDLNKLLDEYCNQLALINNFIMNIDDAEIRLIARYRFIENLTWTEIGNRMYLDRTVCYRKMNKYLHSKHIKDVI